MSLMLPTDGFLEDWFNAAEVGENGASGVPATSVAVKGHGFLYLWPVLVAARSPCR